MRAALIKNGIVDNIAVCTDVDAMRSAWSFYDAVIAITDNQRVSIGDVYNGQLFTQVDHRTLIEAIAEKKVAIQARTAELRAIGFPYAGTVGGTRMYTLEHEALRQIELADKWASAGVPEMRYPLVWPSIDRLGFVYMTDASSVRTFALACSLADRAITEAGAGLEMSLAQATTIADVDAIVDSR